MSSEITFRHPLPPASLVKGRGEWLWEEASGKRVLHVGCVDAGLTEERLERGDLLHAQLEETCAKLMGVDIDQDGIATMKRLGFANVLAADIAESSSQVAQAVKDSMGGCDLILCGETLEHVLDMGSFLAGIQRIAKTFDAELIITVPNAFSIRLLTGIIEGVEFGHPDHKHYFSPMTLNASLQQTGFAVQKTLFYSNTTAPKSRLTRFLKVAFNESIFRWRPHLAEGLIMIAKAK